MAQFDYQRVNFDEEGIVSALRELTYVNDCCITSIDDVDADTWEDLLEVFDNATITTIA